MKRRSFLLATALLNVGPVVHAANSQLTAVLSIVGELRVGVIDGAIPFSYTNQEDDILVGHQVDLGQQFARDMGVAVSFRRGDLDDLVEQLAAGDVDIIMAGTPMNVALAKRAAFTMPWGRTGVTPVVTRNAAPGFGRWNQLATAETRVALSRDPQVAAFFQSLAPGKSAVTIASTPEAVEALANGQIDVYLTNTIEASVLTRIDRRFQALFPARIANKRPLASLVRIDDPVWLHYVNTWLTIKRETGYLAGLARKWGLVGQVD